MKITIASYHFFTMYLGKFYQVTDHIHQNTVEFGHKTFDVNNKKYCKHFSSPL